MDIDRRIAELEAARAALEQDRRTIGLGHRDFLRLSALRDIISSLRAKRRNAGSCSEAGDAKAPSGTPRDGGGHATKVKADAQAAAMNASIERKR